VGKFTEENEAVNPMDERKEQILDALIQEHQKLGLGGRSLWGLMTDLGIEATRKELESWFAFERPLRYRGFAFTYICGGCGGLPPTLAILREE